MFVFFYKNVVIFHNNTLFLVNVFQAPTSCKFYIVNCKLFAGYWLNLHGKCRI